MLTGIGEGLLKWQKPSELTSKATFFEGKYIQRIYI